MIAIDVALLALLAGTICYIFLLNKNIAELKEQSRLFSRISEIFSKKIEKIHQELETIKNTVIPIEQELGRRIEHASIIAGDLRSLTQYGDKLAEKLDVLITNNQHNDFRYQEKNPHDEISRKLRGVR